MGWSSNQYGNIHQAGAEYVADRGMRLVESFLAYVIANRAQEEMLDNLGAISYFIGLAIPAEHNVKVVV